MKRKFLIAAAVLLTSAGFVNAQSMGKGQSVLYLGAGPGSGSLGGAYHSKGAGYTSGRTPTFMLGYEYGISEAIPQSIIGLGPHVTTWFGHTRYRNSFGDGYEHRWSDFTVAAKGFYHHKFLVKDRFDVYGSVLAGLRFRSYRFTSTDAYYNDYERDENAVEPVAGIGIGGRVYVTNVFGFYAEVGAGYNADYAQIGIAFKFK